MELNCVDLLQKTITAFNVNAAVLQKDGSNLQIIDNGFRMRLFEDYDYNTIYEFLKLWTKPCTLIRFFDEFKLTYIFLHIPEEFMNEDSSPFMVIGPFSDMRIPFEEIHQIMQKNNIPDQSFMDMSAFYASIPVISNINTFECTILNLASGLFGQDYRIVYFPEYNIPSHDTSGKMKKLRENPELASASIEERYYVENQMLDAVSAGDYNRAHSCHQKFITYYIHPRTDNILRNTQNFSIILNTLCRKAAEQAGIHPLYIDELSTKFAILINKTYSIRELNAISNDIIHKYCLLVKNHALKGYSPVTKEIISYIDFHYMEELNLNFFADMFNIAKTYLSSLFKKETGSTLTDYIHQIRMRRAITLINSSSLSVTTIATACGYNDINYFIRIFKRTYGLSPKQYQKNVLPVSR